MPNYKVTYKIEIDAPSSEHAARWVDQILRDEESIAPAFEIVGNDGGEYPLMIDCSKLPNGYWYVQCEEGELLGPYDSQNGMQAYEDACRDAEDVKGIVRFIES